MHVIRNKRNKQCTKCVDSVQTAKAVPDLCSHHHRHGISDPWHDPCMKLDRHVPQSQHIQVRKQSLPMSTTSLGCDVVKQRIHRSRRFGSKPATSSPMFFFFFRGGLIDILKLINLTTITTCFHIWGNKNCPIFVACCLFQLFLSRSTYHLRCLNIFHTLLYIAILCKSVCCSHVILSGPAKCPEPVLQVSICGSSRQKLTECVCACLNSAHSAAKCASHRISIPWPIWPICDL